MATAATLRTTDILALAAVLLTACGKPADKPPAIPRAKLVSEVEAEKAAAAKAAQPAEAPILAPPVAPPAPLSPAQWATGLKASTASLEQEGFVLKSMNCDPHTAKDDGVWVIRCRTMLTDGHRGGKPAILDYELYDRDMGFDPLDAPVRQHIEALKGNWTINSKPDITVDNKKTGAHYKYETACHQALGRSNSPAYCTLLFNPRIFIIAGVKPDLASTSHVTMGEDPDKSSSRDVHHASDLSFLAVVTAQAVK